MSCSQETLLFKTAHWRLNSNHTWLKYSKTRKKLTNALRTAKVQYLKNLSTAIRSPRDFRSSYHKLSPKRQRTTASDLKFRYHMASSSISKTYFSTNFSSPALPVLLCLGVLTSLRVRQADLALFFQTSAVPRRF